MESFGDGEGHQHPERNPDPAEMEALADVARAHEAIVHPVHEHEAHLEDEHDAEEERQAAERLLAGALEGGVVDAVYHHADEEEGRRGEHADQHRVEPKPAVQDPGDVRADDDERRVGDVDDVELAEADGEPDRHGGIEAAEQNPRDEGIRKEIDRKHRRAGPCSDGITC